MVWLNFSNVSWIWFWVEFLDGWQWTTANIYPFVHTGASATWYWFNKDLSTVEKKIFFKYGDSTGNGAWVSF